MTRVRRTALFFAPLRHTFSELCASFHDGDRQTSGTSDADCMFAGPRIDLSLHLTGSAQECLELIGEGYYNLVIIDCRHLPHSDADAERQERALAEFLDGLAAQRDPERRYPFRRVVVLVGDADEERVDRLIFAMGQRHVGACLRDFSLSLNRTGETAVGAARGRFVEAFWRFCHEVLLERKRGTTAINTAGGGISGIYYELGVLKCLHDAIDRDIRDFDLFYGISGGAVVAGFLANGYSIDEILLNLGAVDTDWPYRLRLSWRHLNVGEVPKRVLLAQKELLRYLGRTVRRTDDLSVASILGTSGVAFGPLFDNRPFEAYLRYLFTRPGRSNDFRTLPVRLFVGATEQDRRQPVLFGEIGQDDVPISKAIQASAAMHPFFPSVEINGRRYTDGIVTRTSNLGSAIAAGADLVFAIDPFVPLISDEPAFNARHGNLWVAEQDYKTLSFTRFEQARDVIMRVNPQVNIYTFVPSNRMRHLMSNQNPFVSRNFHPIVCEAYRSTWRRLKQLEYKMQGELASHEIRLDLGPVEEKVRRLRSARRADVHIVVDNAPRLGPFERLEELVDSLAELDLSTA
jgi:NTE family protein